MSSDAKIVALLRAIDVGEHELLQERSPILEIVEQRQVVFEELKSVEDATRKKLLEGKEKLRSHALRNGRVGALADWERFSRRLEKELAALEPKIKDAEKELISAQNRLATVDEELLANRLERKRIERVLENREEQERIQSQALDDASSDDLSIYKNRK